MQNKNSWDQEYQAFLEGPGTPPPGHLSEQIKSSIHQKLNPSKWVVFTHLCLTHLVMSAGVLTLCPHFGVQIIPGFSGLTFLFMKVGHAFCMTMCGFLIMSPSLLFVALWFKSEELKVFYRHRKYQVIQLVCVTLFILLGWGQQTIDLQTLVPWVLGAIFGGMGVFEVGLRLNRGFIRS